MKMHFTNKSEVKENSWAALLKYLVPGTSLFGVLLLS